MEENRNYESLAADSPHHTPRLFEAELNARNMDAATLVSVARHAVIIERYDADKTLQRYEEVVALVSTLFSCSARSYAHPALSRLLFGFPAKQTIADVEPELNLVFGFYIAGRSLHRLKMATHLATAA